MYALRRPVVNVRVKVAGIAMSAQVIILSWLSAQSG